MIYKLIAGLALVILSAAIFAAQPHSIENKLKPNFSTIKDVNEKKKAFFEYMYPFIRNSNQKILGQREKLHAINNKKIITSSDKTFLSDLCNQHKLSCKNEPDKPSITKLLLHVHIVPPSLALAQAANESGWGTSRFSLKGNNYFGQWCHTKGCGLVPINRNAGATHEVQRFKSTQNSVDSYVLNINSGTAYSNLRDRRALLSNKSDQKISGIELAEGLTQYSERGNAYVKDIKNMISMNKLTEYDRKFWTEVS